MGEQDTKAALISPVLRALGWDVEDVEQVRHEYRQELTLQQGLQPAALCRCQPNSIHHSADQPRQSLGLVLGQRDQALGHPGVQRHLGDLGQPIHGPLALGVTGNPVYRF